MTLRLRRNTPRALAASFVVTFAGAAGCARNGSNMQGNPPPPPRDGAATPGSAHGGAPAVTTDAAPEAGPAMPR